MGGYISYNAGRGRIPWSGRINVSGKLHHSETIMKSKIQQKLRFISICHLQDANDYMVDVLSLRPCIRFIRQTGIWIMKLVSMINVSHGAASSVYGQSGNITGVRIAPMGECQSIYNIFGCTSHKQWRVTYSTLVAEFWLWLVQTIGGLY